MPKSFDLPTPHGDKLASLLQNDKLPKVDKPNVESAQKRYAAWRDQLKAVTGSSEDIVRTMVAVLNEYKLYLDVELIFDSKQDFLYRQKGQLKLDNSVLEEFLPLLVTTVLAEELKGLELSFGPVGSFAALRFDETIKSMRSGAAMSIRSKDQDFAISRKLYVRASHHPDFQDVVTSETNIAYVATEIKTNLDKTMFQEAAATALDVKSVAPGTRYYLLCDWLDMTPTNTTNTAIDEVLILRRAKRLGASIRSAFSTVTGRSHSRSSYLKYLTEHPLDPGPFSRYVGHIRSLVVDDTEDDVLARGFF